MPYGWRFVNQQTVATSTIKALDARSGRVALVFGSAQERHFLRYGSETGIYGSTQLPAYPSATLLNRCTVPLEQLDSEIWIEHSPSIGSLAVLEIWDDEDIEYPYPGDCGSVCLGSRTSLTPTGPFPAQVTQGISSNPKRTMLLVETLTNTILRFRFAETFINTQWAFDWGDGADPEWPYCLLGPVVRESVFITFASFQLPQHLTEVYGID